MQVASNKPFAPAYFDARPMTEVAAKVPPERPYRLGEGARELPAEFEVKTASRAPTTELAAAARPQPVRTVASSELPAAEPEVSPVSAYAPTRYDQPAGFMSGRGLY